MLSIEVNIELKPSRHTRSQSWVSIYRSLNPAITFWILQGDFFFFFHEQSLFFFEPPKKVNLEIGNLGDRSLYRTVASDRISAKVLIKSLTKEKEKGINLNSQKFPASFASPTVNIIFAVFIQERNIVWAFYHQVTFFIICSIITSYANHGEWMKAFNHSLFRIKICQLIDDIIGRMAK